ncbi:Uncharacterised protein [Vibrio cholerae]|nr:Uncharacterised protein [Vibrio cholerae]
MLSQLGQMLVVERDMTSVKPDIKWLVMFLR